VLVGSSITPAFGDKWRASFDQVGEVVPRGYGFEDFPFDVNILAEVVAESHVTSGRNSWGYGPSLG